MYAWKQSELRSICKIIVPNSSGAYVHDVASPGLGNSSWIKLEVTVFRLLILEFIIISLTV